MGKEISGEKVDIEKIMEKIKEKARKKKELCSGSEDPNTTFEIGKLTENDNYPIENLRNCLDTIKNLNALMKIWDPREKIPITSHRKIIGPVIVLVKNTIRKVLTFFGITELLLSRQAEFNFGMVNILKDLTTGLNVKDSFLSKKILEVRQENILLKNRLDRILTEIKEKHDLSDESTASLVREKMGLKDHDYFLFENKYRGPQEEIKKKQQSYLSVFKGASNVLDIACGRGEFLEILRKEGIKSFGIDINEDMIYVCKDKNLDVIQVDALAYLSSIKDASLGGIFASHVIEHLTNDKIIELLKLCFVKLKTGAYFVLETPNPLSIIVSATNFYRDLSHIRPLHPEAMKFLMEANGFVDVQIKYLSPFPKEEKLQVINHDQSTRASGKLPVELLNKNIQKLNNLLYGYQDYAIISKKEKG